MSDPGSAEHQLGSIKNAEIENGAVKNAELGLGAPRKGAPRQNASRIEAPRFYTRGYLPHYDKAGAFQMITYRLADSLPKDALAQLKEELKSLPEDARDTARRQQIESWLDAGHGSCVLRHSEAASCVMDTWQHFDGVRYEFIAGVVMPNHCHVLIRVFEGAMLGKIVQSWKSYTGRRITKMMEECRAGARRSQERRSQEPPSKEKHSQEGHSRGIWMREYWDRFIRDEKHFANAIEYIHNNPVKAGLVKNAEDWYWSSVGGRGIEKINQECEAAGVSVPEYRTDASGLMVKFNT